MADAWLRSGVDPDAPDEVLLVVVVETRGPAGERAVSRFGAHAYEGDRAFYVVQTDAWVERRLDGDTLTVDVVAHSAVLKRLGIEQDGFADRSRVDPHAVRLLRVVSAVDPALCARVPETTIVFAAPSGGPADKVVAALNAEADWPVIYAPPPAPRDVATEHPQGAG